ncbi:ergothioneine biosynthesis protein EgtB [Hellea balneolensis]|uniref:ergothioneine biosynthesis protein EgtB n=1 Tax=Hellea balneolensis TaxID=287478 RepID=UPI003898E1C4
MVNFKNFRLITITFLEQYNKVRATTERLCAPLHIEDYVPQAVSFASPPKWHLAHTAWFFEDMVLKTHLVNYPAFDPDFTLLFNSYYQSVARPFERTMRGVITRPTVAQVYAYREHVDKFMRELLRAELTQELADIVTIGLNHEQQHQELLITDLKYVFGLNPTWPIYDESCDYLSDTSGDAETEWVSVSEGLYDIGFDAAQSEDRFCFDNEMGRHKVYLQDFKISKSLVTNSEYLAFMQAGGYKDFSYWLDEGWAWVQSESIQHPLYWQLKEGRWHHYTLAGLKPLDLNVSVAHISYYEAEAFARWKGYRLPTEFEWEVAANDLNWGARWEWTSSAYAPYPGFKIADGALGEYNGKFMVNQMVLRGASNATAPDHSRVTYRNFFHPHSQWQYSGIRLSRYI